MGMLLRRYHDNNDNGVVNMAAPKPIVEEKIETVETVETVEEVKYNKMDIWRMKGTEVRELAVKNGIDITDATLVDLKKALCSKLVEE